MHALGSKPIALIDAMSGVDAYRSRKYNARYLLSENNNYR